MKHYQITVKGPNVQRCGFRKEASRIAGELQLAGMAEYLNKDVYIDIEGKADNVNLFLQWCHIGPDGVMIEGVEIIESPLACITDFKVVPGVNITKIKKSA